MARTAQMRPGTSWIWLAIAVFQICAPAIGEAVALPPKLEKLRSERAGMAAQLAKTIAVCAARHDTSNPSFHGCIDWHSAVHGTWALVAYARATGDKAYQPLVDSILQPALLAEEREHLTADPEFEMPYGRAWFLRLAIDYRRAFHDGLLDAFADEVAASIMARYKATPPDPNSITYDSATWALINLRDYGVARGNQQIVDFVNGEVRKYYLKDGPCPLQRIEVDTGEFMAVCTNWAWIVGDVLPREEFIGWLGKFLPAELALKPIAQPSSVHQAGLNFSRAWGLWSLYRKTGDPRFLDAYVDHFNETYSRPNLWKGGYRTVGHWVPQFGMLALMLTYDDWP
jgi:hypothetical protein